MRWRKSGGSLELVRRVVCIYENKEGGQRIMWENELQEKTQILNINKISNSH